MKYNLLQTNMGPGHPYGTYEDRQVLNDGSISITLSGLQPWAAATGENLLVELPPAGAQGAYVGPLRLSGKATLVLPEGLPVHTGYLVGDVLYDEKTIIGTGVPQVVKFKSIKVGYLYSPMQPGAGFVFWTPTTATTGGKKLVIQQAEFGINEPAPLWPWVLGLGVGAVAVGAVLSKKK